MKKFLNNTEPDYADNEISSLYKSERDESEEKNSWDAYVEERVVQDYLTGLNKKDLAVAYSNLNNDINLFIKRQLKELDIRTKAELEKFRKLEYEALSLEEKKRIAGIKGAKTGNREVLPFELLTERQKNAIALSPVYFLNSQITDLSVYISSYLNFAPIARKIYVYARFSQSYKKDDKADFLQEAMREILETMTELKTSSEKKIDRKSFINKIQNNITDSLQNLIGNAIPSFEKAGRHKQICLMLDKIEEEQHKEYYSNDSEDVLRELTDEINKRLNNTRYLVDTVRKVLKKRETREEWLDESKENRYYGATASAEEIFFGQVDGEEASKKYERILQALQTLNKTEKQIAAYKAQGYTAKQIGERMDLKPENVRQIWKRARAKIIGKTEHLTYRISFENKM